MSVLLTLPSRPAAPGRAGPVARGPSTGRAAGGGQPFVGRAGELAAIARAVDAAGSGTGSVVTVTGEAAIGRTRLCEEAADRAAAAGARVVWGRGASGGDVPPLWPWPSILDRLAGAAGHQPGSGALHSLASSPFDQLDAVVRQLAAWPAAVERPVLVVLDDLHLAPPNAQRLTELVAGEVRTLGIVLLATRRSGGGHRASRSGVVGGSTLHLRGLDRHDAAQLLAADGLVLDDDELARVLHHTEGRPGWLRRVAGGGPAHLDLTLAGVVTDRLDQLDEAAARACKLASVLGQGASVAELAELADEPAGSVVDALGRSGGLVHLDGGALGFTDASVAGAVRATLPPGEVLAAEARAAEVTAPRGGDAPVERLARHAGHALAAAGRSPADAVRAIDAARAAARALVAAGSPGRAADLLGAAVTAGSRHAPDAVAADLLVERAEAELSTGHLAAARTHFHAAVTAAERAGDVRSFAAAALGLGGVWVNEHRGSVEGRRVLALQRRALDLLPPDERVLRGRLEVRLGAEAAYQGGSTDAVRAALAHARQLGDGQVLAEALSLCHHTLLGPEHAHERLALADELIDVAAASGAGPLTAIGLCWRTVDLFLLGDPTAERSLRDLHRRLEQVPVRSTAYVAAAIDVGVLIRRGRLDEAELAAERCLAMGTTVGDADALGWYGAHLCAIRWLQGRGDEVIPLVQDVLASPTLAPLDHAYPAVLADLAAEAGQLDLATAALSRLPTGDIASIPRSSTWLTAMLSLAQAAATLGDPDLARQVDGALRPFADLPTMPSLALVCLGSTHRPLGLTARTLGDLDRAVEHLEVAVTANRSLGNRPMTAVARADLAEALADRGQPGDVERAAPLLRQAAADACRMGMHRRARGWSARAEDLDRRRPVPQPDAASLVRRSGHWVLSFAGTDAVLPHRVGLAHLAGILAAGGRDVTALELAAGEGAGAVDRSAGRQAVLDDRALADYRRRLQELGEELDDAQVCNDTERAARAQYELDAVLTELEHASGLAGRSRSFVTDAERARTSVCKAIKRAIAQIAAAHPEAGRLLADGITTGLTCRYDAAVPWVVR